MEKKKTKLCMISKVFMMTFIVVLLIAEPAFARRKCGACKTTAQAAYKAALCEAWDDYWIARGNCYNLSDSEAGNECLQEAREELKESFQTAIEQRQARLEICGMVGEAPYDPMIDPENFIDFEEVFAGNVSFVPNQYFPLAAATTWEYLAYDEEGEISERIIVEVLEETKEIQGVNCIVVRDRVWEIEDGDEVLVEDTLDWYAQDLDGNVWYFGEIAKNYEDGELADLEGSWESGKDYAKAGYLMLIDPQEDDVYRQEFLLGEAEDMAQVSSRGVADVSIVLGDFNVDVLETREWTPIEPDVVEFKYYAPGVGMILEFNPDTGERVELINITTP